MDSDPIKTPNRWKSILDLDRFSTGTRPGSVPNREVNRLAYETDRTIDKAAIDSTGVIGTRSDMGSPKGSVTTSVLLSRWIVGVEVPVDWQGVVVKRVVVDATTIILQPNIIDPSASGTSSTATCIITSVDQADPLGNIPRGSIGRVIDCRSILKLTHHF
jgi:hypothetical protein